VSLFSPTPTERELQMAKAKLRLLKAEQRRDLLDAKETVRALQAKRQVERATGRSEKALKREARMERRFSRI
jgi:hypothetical protein